MMTSGAVSAPLRQPWPARDPRHARASQLCRSPGSQHERRCWAGYSASV